MSKTCKCGFTKENSNVTHKCEYTKWGWFLLTILGMSAKPKSVEYLCTKCGEIICISTDPTTLTKFVGR